MTIEKLLHGKQIVAVLCNQWGDTGKGKYSEILAHYWADIIARGTGGNNAGHTVVVNGEERIFHLLPAGILHDKEGKINILGNGMVIDLMGLTNELNELDQANLTYNNLRISEEANIIMPYHVISDKAKNQSLKSGGIGSTGRGIGPCYTDKIARRGIRMIDLIRKDTICTKIKEALEHYPETNITLENCIDYLDAQRERIIPFIRDTETEIQEFIRQGKKISIEGAQGLHLSIEHGSYPYVTSSDCSLNGTANGIGISAAAVDLTLGIIKFPFMTRVGGGPFPTELGGIESEEYCAEEGHTKREELEKYKIPYSTPNGKISYSHQDQRIIELMNSSNQLEKSIGIRLAAGEFGATTGRPRRVGWTDAAAAKHAVGINGPVLVLTKVDCLAGMKEFGISYGYNEGQITNFSRDAEKLRTLQPHLKMYKGYDNISGIRSLDDLPAGLRYAMNDFETFTGGKTAIISTGAERDDNIFT